MTIDSPAQGPKGEAQKRAGAKSGTALPYSNPIAVSTLHGETHLVLEPDQETRARIARSLGLHALSRLKVKLSVRQAANGLVSIDGDLEAELAPICVISLEPFDQVIREPVSVRFAPEELIARLTRRAEEADDDDFEPPDPIIDNTIDFGALATEFLALALDPYPKRPGVEFAPFSEGDAPASPFEKLKALSLKENP